METDAPLGGLLPVSLLIKIRRSETEEEAEEEEGEGEEEGGGGGRGSGRRKKSRNVTSGSCLLMCDHMERIWEHYGTRSGGTDQEPDRQGGREGRGELVPVGHTRGATCRRSHPVTCHRFIYFYGVPGRWGGRGRKGVVERVARAPNGVEPHQTLFSLSGWRRGWQRWR